MGDLQSAQCLKRSQVYPKKPIKKTILLQGVNHIDLFAWAIENKLKDAFWISPFVLLQLEKQKALEDDAKVKLAAKAKEMLRKADFKNIKRLFQYMIDVGKRVRDSALVAVILKELPTNTIEKITNYLNRLLNPIVALLKWRASIECRFDLIRFCGRYLDALLQLYHIKEASRAFKNFNGHIIMTPTFFYHWGMVKGSILSDDALAWVMCQPLTHIYRGDPWHVAADNLTEDVMNRCKYYGISLSVTEGEKNIEYLTNEPRCQLFKALLQGHKLKAFIGLVQSHPMVLSAHTPDVIYFALLSHRFELSRKLIGVSGLPPFALHWAIRSRSLKQVKWILERAAVDDINLPDDWGYTPLMLAALTEKTGLVKLLLKRGADKDVVVNHRKAYEVALLCDHRNKIAPSLL